MGANISRAIAIGRLGTTQGWTVFHLPSTTGSRLATPPERRRVPAAPCLERSRFHPGPAGGDHVRRRRVVGDGARGGVEPPRRRRLWPVGGVPDRARRRGSRQPFFPSGGWREIGEPPPHLALSTCIMLIHHVPDDEDERGSSSRPTPTCWRTPGEWHSTSQVSEK